jgi:hypothetical protein
MVMNGLEGGDHVWRCLFGVYLKITTRKQRVILYVPVSSVDGLELQPVEVLVFSKIAFHFILS